MIPRVRIEPSALLCVGSLYYYAGASSPALGSKGGPPVASSPALGSNGRPPGASSPALGSKGGPPGASSPALGSKEGPPRASSPALGSKGGPPWASSPALGSKGVPPGASSPALGSKGRPPRASSPALGSKGAKESHRGRRPPPWVPKEAHRWRRPPPYVHWCPANSPSRSMSFYVGYSSIFSPFLHSCLLPSPQVLWGRSGRADPTAAAGRAARGGGRRGGGLGAPAEPAVHRAAAVRRLVPAPGGGGAVPYRRLAAKENQAIQQADAAQPQKPRPRLDPPRSSSGPRAVNAADQPAHALVHAPPSVGREGGAAAPSGFFTAAPARGEPGSRAMPRDGPGLAQQGERLDRLVDSVRRIELICTALDPLGPSIRRPPRLRAAGPAPPAPQAFPIRAGTAEGR
eukprot:gene12738-biopygen8607